MKRVITTWVIILMIVALIAGCTPTQAPSQTTNPPQPTPTSGRSPTDETPDVVSMVLMCMEIDNVKYPRSWDRPGLAAVKAMALEKFGIDIELEEVSSVETKSIINTRLAADLDLPDILATSVFSLLERDELFRNGKIISLTDYKEYMPNFLQALEEIPSLMPATANSDGEILSFKQIVFNRQHVTTWGAIRHDWLETLDMDYPTTMVELRDTLRAFQENDMNGNGKKDEALILPNNPGGGAANQVFGQAFGAYNLDSASESWDVNADGKVVHSMTTDQAKAYLEFMHSMYEEGLIWQQSFTATNEERQAFDANDARAAFIGYFWDPLLVNIDGFSKSLPHEFTPILPLGGDGYAPKIQIRNYGGGFDNIITKACEYPERAISFIDYFFTLEGSQLAYYGEISPGGEWYESQPVADILTSLGLEVDPMMMVLTEKGRAQAAIEENITLYLGVNSSGIWPTKSIGSNDSIAAEYVTAFDVNAARIASNLERNLMLLDWTDIPGNAYQQTILAAPTSEQSDAIRDAAELYTYMDEMFVKFMTGVESLDKWDEFLNTCRSIGLDEITSVMQQRYDTYLQQQ